MKKLGVFLLVFGASALFNRADLSSVDEGFIFNTTASLVEKHSFQMDEQLSGRKYSRFSPLPSFFAAPFYAVADKLIDGPFRVGVAKKRDWLLFGTGLSSCVLTAWTAVALLGLLRSLNYSEDTAVWTSLLWAFGTLAFPYSSSLFHQVMATLLMVYVVRFSLEGRLVGTAITTALLLSIQLTLAATVLPLFLRDRGRPNRRTMVGLAIGILGGFGLHVLTNWLRGDHWLHGAYETETFTTPTFVGTVGLFFSSGKGLLWFAPLAFVGLLMLLPFAYRRPEIGRPLLFAVTCHCLVVIHWWAWHGSLSWGPRLLLPILPLMMIPIADLIERRSQLSIWQSRLLGTVAAISVMINAFAATQPMIGFLNSIPSSSIAEWVFIPSLSPLIQPPTESAFGVDRLANGAAWILKGPIVAAPVVGALLCFLAKRRGVLLSTLAPWRALALVSLGYVLEASITSLDDFQPLVISSYKDGAAFSGTLQFPIRGIYRIEAIGLESESIQIGASRLVTEKPIVYFEAPPMSVRIEGGAFSSDHPKLCWTLPGDGQYRTPIPAFYFKENRFIHPWRKGAAQMKDWTWLLCLLAVPLYFDWLLGGRRMKEANEVGTEAKT